ncbi:thioredoxin-like protein [Marasmius fiardii PR-910]|nr:thioredoxin-like protein [Marasmius fiardii PR-910]
MSAFNRKVKLTVINDLVCANCAIGQHELISAISYCQDVLHLPLTFEIECLPFRLIPTNVVNETTPKVQKCDFFMARFGREKFEAMESGIKKWSEEKNIPLCYKGVVSQSTRAHRLSRKAYFIGGQDKQLPLLCNLFKAYLEEGKDINDLNVLADVAQQTGVMKREEAIAFLRSDELEAEVNNMCDEARSKGVTGVPMTVIDGKWVLNGGQCSDVFVQVFKKLAYAGVHAAPSPFAAPVQEISPQVHLRA